MGGPRSTLHAPSVSAAAGAWSVELGMTTKGNSPARRFPDGDALLPNAVWRWSTAAMVGQLLAMIVLRPSGTDLGLLPLAIIFVLVPMAILLTIPALIGGMIARRGWHADLI